MPFFSKYILLPALALATHVSSEDLTQYVLPSVGQVGGNTFPGVSLPFGMVKLGPDVYTGQDSYSGWAGSGVVTGFSMMHESGTGGAPKYGVVSQMPITSNIVNPLDDLHDTRTALDVTSVGHYKTTLGSNITVDLAATPRAGLYQYTFLAGTASNIVVDVSHVLPSYRGMGLSQNYLGGSISTSLNHYEGYGDYNNGWNRAPDWRIYFCGYFNDTATVKTFVGKSSTGSVLSAYDTTQTATSTARLGAVFTFSSPVVVSRVGISFISSSQACKNVNEQIAAGTTLSSVVAAAKQTWNDQVLSKVTTTETNLSNLQLLYTSIYHMHLLPSNRTGENPLWTSPEPYYDDTFTTWDLFRCTFALLQIFQPVMHSEYARSLIDIFRFEGYMPDARSSNYNGATQGGSNSDNILADAYVKGVRGAINWTAGYEAMVKNAEVVPPNNNDPRDPSSSTKEGRGALLDWLSLGYITTKYGRSVTCAVEYSVNDFSLYQVAKGLGLTSSASKYLSRSRQWRNHWNPTSTSLNFTGFLSPRSETGFLPQDPLSCGGCYWGDAFYEALPWEYSFNPHHDISTLISLSGGPSRFKDRLETTFLPNQNPSGRSSNFDNMIFNPGNEPSFTTPYLYHYINRPDLSVSRSRAIAKKYYHPTTNGLPGNSDAGAMESWLLWNILGLYPMVPQNVFLITSPWFSNTTLSLTNHKSLTITTTGGSDSNYHVQSLKVNGKPWSKSWVSWQDIFENGGSMEFVLGKEARNWTDGRALPSPGSEGQEEGPVAEPGNGNIGAGTDTGVGSGDAVEEARKKKDKDITLGVVGLVIFVFGSAGLFAWWWFWGWGGKFGKGKRKKARDEYDSRRSLMGWWMKFPRT